MQFFLYDCKIKAIGQLYKNILKKMLCGSEQTIKTGLIPTFILNNHQPGLCPPLIN